MAHVVLLGDSIFDNALYVPDRPPLIEQVRRGLPAGWKATLLAADGSVTEDVARQLSTLPADATHLFISAGGNDALGESGIIQEPAASVAEVLGLFNRVQTRFRAAYHEMLQAVLARGKPTTLCTIYDAIPGLGEEERLALGVFNEVILRSAFLAGLPVIDLRILCSSPADYSDLSPIEPSHLGGAKIAGAIAEVALRHDFALRRSVIYT